MTHKSETTAHMELVNTYTIFEQKAYIFAHGAPLDYVNNLVKNGELSNYYNRVKKINRDLNVKEIDLTEFMKEHGWKFGKK